MGLDMYAYSAVDSDQYFKYWDNRGIDEPNPVSEPKELAYWRKHPNLHGWMENLWLNKGRPIGYGNEDGGYYHEYAEFNGIQLELTWEDLDKLESDVENKRLPQTSGFFFGSNSDDYYYEKDLNFIKEAKADLFVGLRIFYNSSW